MCNPKNGAGTRKKGKNWSGYQNTAHVSPERNLAREPTYSQKKMNGVIANPPNHYSNASCVHESALSIYNLLVERKVSTHK